MNLYLKYKWQDKIVVKIEKINLSRFFGDEKIRIGVINGKYI